VFDVRICVAPLPRMPRRRSSDTLEGSTCDWSPIGSVVDPRLLLPPRPALTDPRRLPPVLLCTARLVSTAARASAARAAGGAVGGAPAEEENLQTSHEQCYDQCHPPPSHLALE
jgi:hypothetical protein